jgi:hypothetical protein
MNTQLTDLDSAGMLMESGDSILSCFQKASVDLTAERALLKRVDTKFILKEDTALEVLDANRDNYKLLPAGDALAAVYKTLYFDTENLLFFHDHRRGRRLRYKVRIRNYPDRNVGFLEIKKRINPFHKEKYRVERQVGDFSLTDNDMDFIYSKTGNAERLSLTIQMVFYRITLINSDANERVTFDYGLSLTSGNKKIKMSGIVIVEIKQWPFTRSTKIMKIIKSKQIRGHSLSKYCAGIILTRPGVQSNRLLPQIRVLNGGII